METSQKQIHCGRTKGNVFFFFTPLEYNSCLSKTTDKRWRLAFLVWNLASHSQDDELYMYPGIYKQIFTITYRYG